MMWQSSSTHEPIRVRDQRIAKMPIAVEREGLTPAQKLDSLAVCGIFGTVMAWLIFTPLAGFITGLTMTAICLTVWVRDRRQS